MLDRAISALRAVPCPENREDWWRVLGSALAEGVEEADLLAWCAAGPGYCEADALATIRSLARRPAAGSGSLFKLARAAGWRDDQARPRDPAEQARRRTRLEARRAQEQAEAKRRAARARRKAEALWAASEHMPTMHPYLQRKQVQAHGVGAGIWSRWNRDDAGGWIETRIPGALLVPMLDVAGQLHSLQAIFPEPVDGRDKDFLSGGEMAGHFHSVGTPSADLPLCVAEGYATAASIHEATGWPAAVAFAAGNLRAVAEALHVAYPEARILVCGDDDHTAGNPGRVAAEAAARAVGGIAVLPEFGPDRPDGWSDFNDLAQSKRPGEGPDAVKRTLEAAVGASEAPVCPAEHAAPAETASTDPASDTPAPDAQPPKKSRTHRAGKRPARGAPPAQTAQGFELRDGQGVYQLKAEKRGDSWEEVEHFICAPLQITHMLRDTQGGNWQRLALFTDHDHRPRRVLVPDELLEGDGLALAKMLRREGLFVGNNKGGLLKMYVNGCRPNERARLTSRVGWHEDCEHPGTWAYVQGGDLDPIAPPGAELWLHAAQGSGHAQFRQAGTLADWSAGVAALAVGNSRLCFALSAAFASGLIWLHPNVAGGFHWAGGSSLGKSGLLYAAASLCGAPAYRRTWLLTATAIEGVAAGHCDAPLLLDELKQAGNPRDVAQAAYMLTSGQGKGRGQAAGGLRETSAFSLLFQSNGEIGLTQFLEESQERSYAGQEVRFCELQADAGAGFGCWEVLHGQLDGARFTEALQRAAAMAYGTAYPAFISQVVTQERAVMLREFDTLRRAFEKHALSDKAGGQAIRAATRFAAVAYAGEKATEWCITGWAQGEATRAALRLFRDWLAAFGGEENREPRRMVEQVQAWIQAHAGARLEDWRRPNASDSHAQRTMNKAGWKRPTKETASLNEADHVLEFLIYPQTFKTELCDGFDPAAVAKELDRRGLLGRDGRHLMAKVREPGSSGTSRLYLLKPAILEASDDAD